MATSQRLSFEPGPDLHPLYPMAEAVAPLLSSSSSLSPVQRSTLYILYDPNALTSVDLNHQDEDGLVFASVVILGFGAESERDVEREECVRLLVSGGASMNIPDNAGWTPLHHAALFAPPTLISFLLTHGCSPLSTTKRKLTALDIITAYSVVPGREDVATFLEEAMRGEGWEGNKLTSQRHSLNEKMRKDNKQRIQREGIGRALDLNSQWWRKQSHNAITPDLSEEELDCEDDDESLLTPPVDYTSMLVYSPDALPQIFDTLITNFRPQIRNAEPANALYMMTRFACLACDHTWVEDFVIGAADVVEATFFSHPDDLTYMVFWLYNCLTWLHLIRCDSAINETCEMLGSFELIEELINTVHVLIIRFAERRIDKLIDTALLDHSAIPSEADAVQFESEWSLFRSPFSSKKKAVAPSVTPSSTVTSLKSTRPSSPTSPSHPPSPVPQQAKFTPATPKGLSSLRNTFNRARCASSNVSLQNLFNEGTGTQQSPQEMTSFLTALFTLLVESHLSPALTTQIWSQVMYWTSCTPISLCAEMFNRILTRRRHLCRSRALQIGMNLGILEEWIQDMRLPRGVETHFAPVRELLHWLQCLSSMDEFPDLVATRQTMKHLNPLQMRRAVRDYRYEVNEPRMSDDCAQLLAQLQKDWERERVKLGVEALRKEIQYRGDCDDSLSSDSKDQSSTSLHNLSMSTTSFESTAAQKDLDSLFDRHRDNSGWVPQQPPETLGELIDSRYMLPLVLPSDPRLLVAVPGSTLDHTGQNHASLQLAQNGKHCTASRSRSFNSTFEWRSGCRQVRRVRLELLDWLDGARSAGRWVFQQPKEEVGMVNEDGSPSVPSSSEGDDAATASARAHFTKMARIPSTARSRTARSSTG